MKISTRSFLILVLFLLVYRPVSAQHTKEVSGQVFYDSKPLNQPILVTIVCQRGNVREFYQKRLERSEFHIKTNIPAEYPNCECTIYINDGSYFSFTEQTISFRSNEVSRKVNIAVNLNAPAVKRLVLDSAKYSLEQMARESAQLRSRIAELSKRNARDNKIAETEIAELRRRLRFSDSTYTLLLARYKTLEEGSRPIQEFMELQRQLYSVKADANLVPILRDSLQQYAMALKMTNFTANCNCESFTDNTLKLSVKFRTREVVNTNGGILQRGGQPIDAVFPVKMVVKKRNSENSKPILVTMKDGKDTLIMSGLFGRTPTSITFSSLGKDFSRRGILLLKQRPGIEVNFFAMNGQPSNSLNLWNLNSQCHPVIDPDDPPYDRTLDLVTVFETHQDSIVLRYYDNGSYDHDTASLYLKGKLFIPVMAPTVTPETIKIPLRMGDNELLLYALSEGSIPPCTIKLEVIQQGNIQTIDLQSDRLTSQGIIIRRL